MKKFDNLSSAINHYPECPFCHQKLYFANPQNTLTFNQENFLRFQLMNDDYLTVNIKTQEISTHLKHSSLGYLTYGTNYQSLKLECQYPDCGMFFFSLQLKFDLNKKIFDLIALSQESFSFEDELNNLIEICNIHLLDVTKMTVYHPSPKTFQVPLLPVHPSNLHESFLKIKNLTAFI